ncbi:hypothetical protein K461DRAFT_293315 [Myriangium duriaei CBS 260.36]|uniref:Uncharacterized protein n=1 Tax=Myriangium duriaei CBS 260.36 TaxID=1168546 RepID=A0A9P4MG03_9PEZI|nr:hypothetical protein K461DRAFT_293315 [Myriangium duriaei CBS 260.36]
MEEGTWDGYANRGIPTALNFFASLDTTQTQASTTTTTTTTVSTTPISSMTSIITPTSIKTYTFAQSTDIEPSATSTIGSTVYLPAITTTKTSSKAFSYTIQDIGGLFLRRTRLPR